MSVIELPAQLRGLDAHIVLDGGRLRLNAPAGALTDAHREQPEPREAELVEFLHRTSACRAAAGHRPVATGRQPSALLCGRRTPCASTNRSGSTATFGQASGIRFKLLPRETLFVPAGWWHTARILSTSITVSINAANQPNWGQFSRDYCAGVASYSRLKAALLLPYMLMLGEILARISGEIRRPVMPAASTTIIYSS